MAWWGIALSRWTNPMVPNIRPAAVLQGGREALDSATAAGSRATPREQAYLHAVGVLYATGERPEQRARLAAYERTMAELTQRFPDDTEGRIFHALAIVAAASPADKSYADQLRAGAILEELFARYPDHPGLAHYIIHCYDVPALAPRATAAAQRYAAIAPSAAHALHMPSHTFTRVGAWRASLGTNLRSLDAAVRDGSVAEALHALDYAEYALLQMHQDSAAGALLARLPTLAARFDPAHTTGAAPGSAGVYALAAAPARYALERRDWAAATALVPTPSAFPHADAVTYFARALGAAHVVDLPRARASVDSLAVLRARLVVAGEGYWAEQVAIQQLGADAWVTLASGRQDDAVALMREAARREDATEKAAVTPGPLAPARELLADMLLSLGRPIEALAEYRAVLAREPGRYRALDGAVQAAHAVGDSASQAAFERELVQLTRP
jgi:hypothetical protein